MEKPKKEKRDVSSFKAMMDHIERMIEREEELEDSDSS